MRRNGILGKKHIRLLDNVNALFSLRNQEFPLNCCQQKRMVAGWFQFLCPPVPACISVYNEKRKHFCRLWEHVCEKRGKSHTWTGRPSLSSWRLNPVAIRVMLTCRRRISQSINGGMTMATYEDKYHSMHSKFCHTRLRMRELTWPLIDGSITAPNIKFAVGSTRSYITSAAAFTYQTHILKN